MRLVSQAMRAVFIEMLGVVLVLWLLFGSAAWTVESYAPTRNITPSLTDALSPRGLIDKVQAIRLTRPAAADRRPGSEKVARVLDRVKAAASEFPRL